ncbi:hypothetical protein A1Q1_01714 [Trichosporon asahii var. asahii CBS 2479]|uniref:Uncharacterized protein n=1 Tax=Trichosporon asahii var. asahii (strain ATCC 90039 / CBS 2479 / JCM 2466 / KCTC 7840 / NBRC 103889/ NCYC 2677 / UAMH 7654) TaxID=1186058 RepID=J5QUW3_TRIAS|nr:hypothetical protein A1Q1_01714 [Trichosporon asahii var. asahii CBS 2479]EJT49233.1 hypothetical protein A1Q1_01714 [Trichosporon asahii var. asahii CBS 2479]
MVSFKSAALLFLAATPASAKLWGWPESWIMKAETTKSLWGDPVWQVCDGFSPCNDKCTGVEEFTSNGFRDMRNFSWAILKRKKSAWIDMWQVNSVTYHLYESGKGENGPQGQCEIADAVWWQRKCGSKKITIKMRCWQW